MAHEMREREECGEWRAVSWDLRCQLGLPQGQEADGQLASELRGARLGQEMLAAKTLQSGVAQVAGDLPQEWDSWEKSS